MTEFPTIIEVVAVALEAPDGCILMQKRRLGGHHGNLWEFPGGKVEPGESREAALVREIAEELGVRVASTDLRFVARAPEASEMPAGPLVLFLYRCTVWQGEARCLDAAEIAWLAPDALPALATPPLDRPLIAALLARRG